MTLDRTMMDRLPSRPMHRPIGRRHAGAMNTPKMIG